MTKPATRTLRCAIYTRVSTDHGLEQDFNSLDAQREAAAAYVKSQAHEGWRLIKESFDDGGFSGGSLEQPAMQRLLAAIRSKLGKPCRVRHGDQAIDLNTQPGKQYIVDGQLRAMR